jgi:hypothetical protein
MPVLACAFALTTPAVAQQADQFKERPGPSEIMAKALNRKVDFDGSKIGEMPLTEVLKKLAAKHDITFVILEQEFKAKKIDIRVKKSHLVRLDTKDMTVAKFLDVWLPSAGATYMIRDEYVEIVPLPAKVLASP